MIVPLVPFSELAGVPVHWGTWGRTGTRKLGRQFCLELSRALAALWSRCPWGPPSAILSGGAFVPRKPTPGDRHALGTAFDLSGLDWRDGGGPRLVLGFGERERRPGLLLGIEAHLRGRLPQVLGPWYDRDHLDHWHIDDREEARGFSDRSASDVRFAQAALVHVHGEELAQDGAWGPLSRAAFLRHCSGPGGAPGWGPFLLATMQAGGLVGGAPVGDGPDLGG